MKILHRTPPWAVSALLLLTGCSASLLSTHIEQTPSGGRTPADALFYTLPRTVVKVSVPVSLAVTKDGDYAPFHALFFPDEKAATAGRKLSIKRASFSTRGEPDPRQMYSLKAKGRGAIDQTLTLRFTEQGAVTGIEATVTNQTADVVGGALSLVSGLASRGVLGSGATAPGTEAGTNCTPPTPSDRQFIDCFLSRSENAVTLEAHFRRLPADDRERVLNAWAGVNDPDGKLRRSLFEALAAYDLIQALVRATNDVITRPSDALAGAEQALVRAETRIKALKKEFLGKKETKTWTAQFEATPSECSSERSQPCASGVVGPLFTYVENQGVCDSDHLPDTGGPSDVAAPSDKCTSPRGVYLLLSMEPPGDQIAQRLADNYTRPAPAGLHFIVPAQMAVGLESHDGSAAIDVAVAPSSSPAGVARAGARRLEGGGTVMIAQHGIVGAMPAKLGGKTLTHNVSFYDASGALKSYSLVSKPLATKDLLSTISSSANSYLDAEIKKKTAEAEAADSLNQLERQSDVLKAMVEIQKSCSELEDPPEECTADE